MAIESVNFISSPLNAETTPPNGECVAVPLGDDNINPRNILHYVPFATATKPGAVLLAGGDVYGKGNILYCAGLHGLKVIKSVPDDFDVLQYDATDEILDSGIFGNLKYTSIFGDSLSHTGTSETTDRTWFGKLNVFNNASPVACTVDSALSARFACLLSNEGVGTVTLTPTDGKQINGGATETLATGEAGWLFFFAALDEWRLVRGGGGGGSSSPLTAKGQLWGYTTTDAAVPAPTNDQVLKGNTSAAPGVQWVTPAGDVTGPPDNSKVVALNNHALDTAAALVDGCFYQWDAGSSKFKPVVDRPSWPIASIPGKPGAGQKVIIFEVPAAMVFPANFASPNSYCKCAVNPASTAVFTVYKNNVAVGTISISTGGVATFATVGGVSFTVNAGDELMCQAPGSQDANLTDVGITLVGQRTQTLSNGSPVPILNDRGAYDGVTPAVYQPFDFVTFGSPVSTYLCRVAGTTGIAPVAGTTTTNWRLIAEGVAGGAQPSDIQNQIWTYVGVAGGTANALTLTPSVALLSYVAGLGLKFKASADNTGAVTANVSGLGAKNVVKADGSALAAGDIKNGGIYGVTYNGTALQMDGGGGSSLTVKDTTPSVNISGVSEVRFPDGMISSPSAGVISVLGGWAKLEEHVASSSASLDFTGGFTTAVNAGKIRNYIFTMEGIVTVSSGGGLPSLEFSTNGGSTWDTGANYAWTQWLWGLGTVNPHAKPANYIDLENLADVAPDRSGALEGWIRVIINPFQQYIKVWAEHFCGRVADGAAPRAPIGTVIAAYYMTTSLPNAMRFKFRSTNILEGAMRCYGLSNS